MNRHIPFTKRVKCGHNKNQSIKIKIMSTWQSGHLIRFRRGKIKRRNTSIRATLNDKETSITQKKQVKNVDFYFK